MRPSRSDRLALVFFGAVVGGAAAWAAWWLVAKGGVLVGLGVSTLTIVCALALESAVRGRWRPPPACSRPVPSG